MAWWIALAIACGVFGCVSVVPATMSPMAIADPHPSIGMRILFWTAITSPLTFIGSSLMLVATQHWLGVLPAICTIGAYVYVFKSGLADPRVAARVLTSRT